MFYHKLPVRTVNVFRLHFMLLGTLRSPTYQYHEIFSSVSNDLRKLKHLQNISTNNQVNQSVILLSVHNTHRLRITQALLLCLGSKNINPCQMWQRFEFTSVNR